MTQSTSTDQFAGFYYTSKGILNNEASPLEHLALGQAHNIVANGKRKQLPAGYVVVNYVKFHEKFYAQIGISTGNINPAGPRRYWPAWANEASVVFDVVWVTQITEVPAEYFANQGHNLPIEDLEPIANYVLRNSR